MPSLYNRVAGQRVDRLAALSDGIFAVAMTLLVLDLRVPVTDVYVSERGSRGNHIELRSPAMGEESWILDAAISEFEVGKNGKGTA